jgi:protein prenyltransferase alpha subunit repeat containing protein 1
MTPKAIKHELNLIRHTCETYPRNYHAWAHWHFAIDVCYASIYFHSSISDSDEPGPQVGKRQDFLDIIVAECTRLRRWVDHNVSDYSAMHQLCQSHKLIEHLLRSGTLVPDSAKHLTASALVDQSLSLVTAFPSHESLWIYLRTSLSHVAAENQRATLEEIKAKDFMASSSLQKLVKWFAKR